MDLHASFFNSLVNLAQHPLILYICFHVRYHLFCSCQSFLDASLFALTFFSQNIRISKSLLVNCMCGTLKTFPSNMVVKEGLSPRECSKNGIHHLKDLQKAHPPYPNPIIAVDISIWMSKDLSHKQALEQFYSYLPSQ